MNFFVQSSQSESSSTSVIVPFQNDANFASQLSLALQNWEITNPFIVSDFKGETKEILVFYHLDKKFYFVGLGKNAAFEDILQTFRTLSHRYGQKISIDATIDLRYFNPNQRQIEAISNGFVLGTYQLGLFKTDEKKVNAFDSEEFNVHFIVDNANDEQTLIKAALIGAQIGITQKRVFDLVNGPGNKITPNQLIDWTRSSGDENGFSVKILNKEQLEKEGLDLLLAVNRGSEIPAALIIGEYTPKDWNEGMPHISLVGKGVTFDTGGVSIKESNNLHFMKCDMAGAAAVLGTIESAAKLKLPVKINAIVAATDNLVDALSVKPGDVIGSYLGKTVEIIDTDAEGRLILADALTYTVKNHKPDTLIDLATLTGSCVATFGYNAGGLFSNNDELAAKIEKTGMDCGERVWRLPLWDSYKDDIKSDVADLRNYSGKPVAGAISAAKFLEVFVDNHPNWAHLDIAGVSFTASEFCIQRSATAFGVRLLIDYMKQL